MGDTSEEEKVPKLKDDADFKAMPLEPEDGYILSQIDGSTGVSQIGMVTGLGTARVRTLVDKLEEHEAIEWVDPPVGEKSKERPKARPSKRPPAPPIVGPPPEKAKKKDGPRYTQEELDEPDIEIGEERRKFILETFYRLDDLTFYELLDVDPDADKKEIRKAYFRLSKAFHPDTLYGKRLGAFQKKMEVIFKRITEAYEVLGKKKRRKEYDAYIAVRLKTLRREREMERGRKAAEEIARQAAGGKIDAAAIDVPPAVDAGPAPGAQPPPKKSPPPRPEPEPEPEPATPELERRESDAARQRRRQLMARKLAAAAGRRLPGQSAPKRPAPRPPPAAPTSKKDVLRGLTSSLKATASFTGGVDLAQRYLAQATAQEESGDVMGATNSLRLALALAPDRRDVVEHYERLAFELAREMAEDYAKQAKYEEDNDKYADAALSWAKVAEGRPEDVFPHWRAAHCILKANGDMKQARVYAQRAVDLDPTDFNAHKTLGLVFHAAGMLDSARRALLDASTLDSTDQMVENLLREMKK